MAEAKTKKKTTKKKVAKKKTAKKVTKKSIPKVKVGRPTDCSPRLCQKMIDYFSIVLTRMYCKKSQQKPGLS